MTLYDQDENTLVGPAGYGDPEDDVGLRFVVLEKFGFTGQSGMVEILDYPWDVDAI